MKRIALVLLLLSVFARPTPTLDLPDVKQRGTLRVLLAGDPAVPVVRPHFLAEQNTSIVGLEGEILLGFARLRKLELKLVYVPRWETLIPALLEKKGDLIAGGMTDTVERRAKIDFTVETFPTRNVVVTVKPHRAVRTIGQLRQERVGVMIGTSYVEIVKTAGVPPKNVVVFSDNESLTAALRAGGITATVEGVETALAPQEDDPNREIGMFLGSPQSLAIGVRKEDEQLRSALNEYIGNVRKTPTWNRLVIKYFGQGALEILKRARGE